jgi:hypothetical protein
MTTPSNARQQVTFRRTKTISVEDFSHEAADTMQMVGSLDRMVEVYNSNLSDILERHAPIEDHPNHHAPTSCSLVQRGDASSKTREAQMA